MNSSIKSCYHHFLMRLKKYSLQGWLRYFRLKFQGKKVVVVGSCNMCGKCCQRISLEAGGRWLRREADFKRVLKRNSEFERFNIVGKDLQGFLLFSCSWYSPAGICKDHDNRLEICKAYPDINLYFIGGRMIRNCGYSFREIVPFATILERKIQTSNEEKKQNSDH